VLKNYRGEFFFLIGLAWYFLVAYICPKFTNFTKMEVSEIGKELKVRGLMSELHTRLLRIRPTLSPNTLYRAFNQLDCHTELLRVIRQEGLLLLKEQAAQAEAA